MNTKRFACLILALVLIFTVAFPSMSFADDEFFEESDYGYIEEGYIEEQFQENWQFEDSVEEYELYSENENEFFETDEINLFADEEAFIVEEQSVEDDIQDFEENGIDEFFVEDTDVFDSGIAPEFTQEPTDQTAAAGETVTFTAAADNADSYQWQIDRNDGKGFVDLRTTAQWMGTTTQNFSFVAIEGRDAYKFRVVAKNANGETPSAEVKLILGSTAVPEFTQEPTDQTAAAGETVTFTAAADNADSYQWQIDRGDGKGFVDLRTTAQWMGTTTQNFSFVAIEGRDAFKFRVVAKNANGETPSAEVKLIMPFFTVNEIMYEKLSDTTCRVVKYLGSAAELIVNETARDLTIIEIGPSAFEGNTVLVSIDLPDTIQVIGKRAFAGCSSLSKMN